MKTLIKFKVKKNHVSGYSKFKNSVPYLTGVPMSQEVMV